MPELYSLSWTAVKILIIKLAANNVLIVSLTAWMFAQFLKGAIYSIKQKKFTLRNFIRAGGMPSSHTALVSALATSVGIKEGWESAITAITIIFTFIVMYDSSGVRLAASQQAITINKIMDELFKEREMDQKRLRESLGHNLLEVIVGAVLGVLMALFMMKFN